MIALLLHRCRHGFSCALAGILLPSIFVSGCTMIKAAQPPAAAVEPDPVASALIHPLTTDQHSMLED